MSIVKGLIIGSAVVAVGGGVTFLSWRAEQDELNEELELKKFRDEWDKRDDKQRMELLEQELEKMCQENPDGCKTKEGVKAMVNEKPNWKTIFEDDSKGVPNLKSGFDETCRSMAKEMKMKVFCPP